MQQQAFPERGEIGAIVVFDREDGQQADRGRTRPRCPPSPTQLNTKSYDNLGAAAAAPVSENGLVQAIFVQVKPGKNAFDPAAIEDAREPARRPRAAGRGDRPPLRRDRPGGPVAGLAGVVRSKALAIVSIVTLLLIVVLLALIFRSVIICAAAAS